MIVKVQLSISSNVSGHKPGSSILVYNESRSIIFEQAADVDIVEKMKGRPKAFFHASEKAKNQLEFGDEAPWQDW